MNTKYTKLNHRFGLLEYPVTLTELQEIILEFPKSERTFYEYALKALEKEIGKNESIYSLNTADARLTKTGFIVVAESALIFVTMKGGLTGGANTEKVQYKNITEVDFDIVPIAGNTPMDKGILLLKINNKKRTIRNIPEYNLDSLVQAIRERVSLGGSNSPSEKQESSSAIRERLIREKHPTAWAVESASIGTKLINEECGAFTQDELIIYKLTPDKKGLSEVQRMHWPTDRTAEVDHFALKSIFLIKESEFVTGVGGKKVQTFLEEKKNIIFTKVPRAFYEKILGFRSKTKWKQITAIIGYVAIICFIIGLFS
ncbi:hypothetical protein A3864_16200 [Priestia endophytica]|uniref:YokE-like PH domain-containing protein n=1 Tax=Priestia endophytica TaxID=135735 RepID=A0AAX1Q6B1_9BACI|nr:hypothetical protein A3864_16200 [Priestia endophytica]